MMYRIVYTLFAVASRLPFALLFVVSDVLAALLYHVVRYRRRIVRDNLERSFPEKSTAEIRGIERRFYRWFTDYFFETVKLLSMSEAEACRRMRFANPEIVMRAFAEGQSVATLLGHHCNWEWLSTATYFMGSDRRLGLIYRPLRDATFDRVFRAIRSRHGGVPVPAKDILRYLLRYKSEGTLSLFGYIADQSPRYVNIHLWLPFLNRETGVFTGAERIIRKMHDAVFYIEMSRPRRGYYVCTFHEMTRAPQSLPEGELTRRFFALLEATVRRDPSHYLWTHNRWKRTRDNFESRFAADAHGHNRAKDDARGGA